MSISFDEETFVAAARAGDFRQVLEPQAELIEAIRNNVSLHEGEPREALGQLGEITSRLLDVERVGLWVLNEKQTRLSCLDLFIASEARHCDGAVLTRMEAPNYFELLEVGGVIGADDSSDDPRTAELARNYLPAFGVGALLDCPILLERRPCGVLRAEHVGGPRRWEGWERLLGSSLAECASVAVEVARGTGKGRWRKVAT